MTDDQKVRQFLANCTHMVVAVTLPDGSPWAVPVKIQERGENFLAWDSRLDTEHSKAIINNPNIMLLCFDTTKDNQVGVYVQASITKVEPKDHGMARYRAEVARTWLNDETYVKREVTT